MNGLDKIIEQILLESDEKAKSIIDEANEKAANIKEQAQQDAKATVDELAEQGQKDAQREVTFAESSAHTEGKKYVLNAKSDIINGIIKEAYDRIFKMKTNDYFDALLNMIKIFARDEDGQVLLNSKDYNRMPDSFEKKVAQASNNRLKISNQPCNIDGGFILTYGGIEENCSFETIFKVKNEQLRDKISSIVF